MTATVRIEQDGERIILTFRREVGHVGRVRVLSRQEALALGLLLTAPAAEVAINLDVTAELSVQIINAPYEEAWLVVRDPRGGHSLIVGMAGERVKGVGRQLQFLGCKSRESRPLGGHEFVRSVSDCYLEDIDEL